MKALLFAVLVLSGCGNFDPQWQGWVYPNGTDLSRSIKIGRFSTLEDCRLAGRSLTANIHLSEDGEEISSDYECGRACKVASDTGLNVCAETAK